jgi:Interferon-related protein conserved region
MHQVFGFEPRAEPAERLTAFEKRMYRSPSSASSKWRTQQRKYDRASNAARKGAVMGGDW